MRVCACFKKQTHPKISDWVFDMNNDVILNSTLNQQLPTLPSYLTLKERLGTIEKQDGERKSVEIPKLLLEAAELCEVSR